MARGKRPQRSRAALLALPGVKLLASKQLSEMHLDLVRCEAPRVYLILETGLPDDEDFVVHASLFICRREAEQQYRDCFVMPALPAGLADILYSAMLESRARGGL